MRGFQAEQQRLSREDFGRRYRDLNETKKNAIDDTEIDLAYQEYLEARQEVAPNEIGEQSAEAEQDADGRVGLVENAYSEAVPQEVREAVDALAKQFGLQISYEDLGSDNGYYIPGTNRVVLDIKPARSAVDDAGRSAYLFTVAHEVGHYARENMSDAAWESFEDHAVTAMGGETVVKAKMQEEDADGNIIYDTEDLAREDVACDFLGQLLSDNEALKQFCDAVRSKTVSQPAARGILGAIRKVLAKLAGNKAARRSDASVQQSVAEGLALFAEDIEAGRKAASEIADALAELAKQPRPLMNSKQAEAILAEAKNKNAAETGDVRHSIKETTDGRIAVIVDDDILAALDTTNWNKETKRKAQKAAKRSMLKFKDGVPVNGITYRVNKDSRNEHARSNSTDRLYRKNKEVFADKLRVANNVDEVIIATVNLSPDGKLKHERTDQFVDFLHGSVLIQSGKNQYTATTVIGVTKQSDFVYYGLEDILGTAFKIKEKPSSAVSDIATVNAMLDGSSSRDNSTSDANRQEVPGKNLSERL